MTFDPSLDTITTDAGETWYRVIEAGDCDECEECYEAVCPICEVHYTDCPCPGPHEDEEYSYREFEGVLYARPLEVAVG